MDDFNVLTGDFPGFRTSIYSLNGVYSLNSLCGLNDLYNLISSKK
jgi:hypothetical protein